MSLLCAEANRTDISGKCVELTFMRGIGAVGGSKGKPAQLAIGQRDERQTIQLHQSIILEIPARPFKVPHSTL
jgi:hypothetical protein